MAKRATAAKAARETPAGVQTESRLNIEYVPLASLKPYERNARTHSEEQIARVAASIKRFKWTNPIIVDGNGLIIAGHARLEAARMLGMKEVPILRRDDLSPEEVRAYTLADNRLALDAGWDENLLRIELSDLKLAGFDLSFTGFNDEELQKLLAPAGGDGLTDPDDIPEEPPVPVSVLGDVWLLGSHVLVCGDSTKADDVAKALGKVKPHLMVTDPPYGVEYDAGWRNKAMPTKNDPHRWRTGSGRAVGQVMNDDKADWREAWALFPGEVAYVWHSGLKSGVVMESLAAADMEVRAQIVWAKSHFAIGRGHYHPMHEPCFYAVRKGATGHWAGDRKQTTLWQIDKPQKSETGHSTQKPVECMERPMRNNSSQGHAVYEPFSGSGTTIIAGQKSGRSVHAIELNPSYVDVAIMRWQMFTGQAATLDGKTYSEVAKARGIDLGDRLKVTEKKTKK